MEERVITIEEERYHRRTWLKTWFDDYFHIQFEQSLWQDDFVVSHDDYFNKDYANIEELKAQAKIVRDEIRKLDKEIGDGNTR
jgi:hypothetical protein